MPRTGKGSDPLDNKTKKKKEKKTCDDRTEKSSHACRMHDRTEQAPITVSRALVAGTGKRLEMILIISRHRMQQCHAHLGQEMRHVTPYRQKFVIHGNWTSLHAQVVA